MTTDPEPPPVTAEDEAVRARGEASITRQIKVLRFLRWPMFATLIVGLYWLATTDNYPFAFVAVLISVLVQLCIALQFMWPTRTQKRALEVLDKRVTRMVWEQQQRRAQYTDGTPVERGPFGGDDDKE